MKLNIILTGATGMVGEGVLHESLLHPDVEHILVLTRKPCGVVHSKLKEIIVADFNDLSSVASELGGYNSCFFCLGVSSIGLKEEEYLDLTYNLTISAATVLADQNPDMTFCYISGKGTDSTEEGRQMWARVKGKTENDLLKLHFKAVYNFRPGFIKATEGMKNTLSYYKYFGWMYPLLRLLYPSGVSTLKEIGLAMITVAQQGYSKPVLEVKDIVAVAKKTS